MQLSPHFADTELGVVGASPQIVANATQLCEALLEPIRAQFGATVLSNGYRPPAENAAAGGVSNSQHLYLEQNSAADMVSFANADLPTVFDWVRLQSGLPFDQVILEYRAHVEPLTPACIHISYNGALATQRREALYGYTNGAGPYTPAEVA
jgi:Peptidase M15